MKPSRGCTVNTEVSLNGKFVKKLTVQEGAVNTVFLTACMIDLWNKRRMGSVVRAAMVKEFESQLELVLADQDLIYNFEADTQFY